MVSLRIATKAAQSLILPSLLVASWVNELDPEHIVELLFEDTATLPETDNAVIRLDCGENGTAVGTKDVVKKLIAQYQLLPSRPLSDIEEWLDRTEGFCATDYKSVEGPMQELDSHLLLRSHILGYRLSIADLTVWGAIRGNKIGYGAIKKGTMVNMRRWFNFIEEADPWITSALQAMNAVALERATLKSKAGASYDIALPDTDKGVVTRFPPEPSGYLHIGHAKAALLNDYFAHEKYKGTMICRFDDTNPSKESAEFQDAILEDLSLMGIKPDRVSYSSDYFEQMYQDCVTMIKEGKAFADDTEREWMSVERWDGVASRNREMSSQDSLTKFSEMKKASTEGQRWCIRAKIDYKDPNKAMRDPVIYRCNLTPHHRTGETWKIYPTYDFCVPIVDALEGVTHALRTIEYRDRNAQYAWMQTALGLRSVHVWDFSRMNFVRTLLSKRKLTKFVEGGNVYGWDDPRFPTIRGIRRRGMTIPALREFILKQGPSRNIINLDWTIFWATNKKHIDPVAPRHTAILKKDAVLAKVNGVTQAPWTEEKPLHGKNPSLGTKRVAFGPTILIDQADAQTFKQDEEITLMSWGNAIVRTITHSLNPLSLSTVTALELDLHLEGDFKTTEKKITWLATNDPASPSSTTASSTAIVDGETGARGTAPELVPVELVDFDYLITKDKIEEGENYEDFLTPQTEFKEEAWADANVADMLPDTICQFERRGYYRCDRAFTHGEKAVFFAIPTGKGGSRGG